MRVLSPTDLRCPVNGKRAYVNEEVALAALEAAWTQRQTSTRRTPTAFPRKIYRCPECGWWHLSSHWSRT